MIVTCPGCASNYRVRNEVVPPTGAQMRCPKCSTMFLAKPPTRDADGAQITPTPHRPQATGASLAPSGAWTASGAYLLRPQDRAPSGAYASMASPASAPPAVSPSGFGARTPSAGILPESSGATPRAANWDVSGPMARTPALGISPDDPFANIDVSGAVPAVPRPVNSGLELHPRGRTDARVAGAPPGGGAAAGKTSRPVVATVLSLLGMVGSLGVFLCGLGFAAWSSGVIDFDPLLMGEFERRFDVRPPRSYVGKDDPSPEALYASGASASSDGDLISAAVAWRRLVACSPNDRAAEKRLQEVLVQLGDPRTAADLAEPR